MKKKLTLTALGVASLLSADPYYPQSSCPNGNCGGSYYQASPPAYQNSPYHPGRQGYYNQQGPGNYNQPGPGYYNQQAPGNYNQPGSEYYNQQGPGNYNQPNYQGQPQRYDQYNQNPQTNWNNSSRPQNNTDADIAKKIHDLLSGGWFSKGYQDVSFAVNNGIVMLQGSVEKLDDKRKVEDAVKKINGVNQVNNQINVRNEQGTSNYSDTTDPDSKTTDTENKYSQDYAATDADQQLNDKIREKLSGGWFSKGFDAIIIKTSNGVVTITGIVDSGEDIQKVNTEISKVKGVRSINNRLNARNNK